MFFNHRAQKGFNFDKKFMKNLLFKKKCVFLHRNNRL